MYRSINQGKEGRSSKEKSVDLCTDSDYNHKEYSVIIVKNKLDKFEKVKNENL